VVSRDAFLAELRIAVLATEDRDGSPYLSAVWFLWDGGAFHVPTAATSRKAQNAELHPFGAISVDARGAQLRGAAASGRLEIVRGGEALELNDRIHRRYVTPAGMEDQGLGGLLRAGDDVTIRLVPERWHSWDMTPSFGERFGDVRLVYPLQS
jgi:predicted pyridoxine 5'-phosphate oxidase superfamily flavin-nucleotide-binding protein